jgi:hypothetical protein
MNKGVTMSLKDYLPKSKDLVPVQARVDAQLVAQVRAKLKKDNLKIVDLVRAAFLDYLNDNSKEASNPAKPK